MLTKSISCVCCGNLQGQRILTLNFPDMFIQSDRSQGELACVHYLEMYLVFMHCSMYLLFLIQNVLHAHLAGRFHWCIL